MKISEIYLSQETELPTVQAEVIDTFLLMRQTTQQLVASLCTIYENVEGARHGLTFALFGSPARYEMLPLSDIDILILREGNQPEAISATDFAIRSIKALPYDKIDIPRTVQDAFSIEELAATNSPDGHIAKALVVETPDSTVTVDALARASTLLDDPKLQLESLIFDYHYLRYRARSKEQKDGANLKYSEGGTRDIVYYDWAADYLTTSEATLLSREYQVPQIEVSLPIICQYLDNGDYQPLLRRAINVINAIKHRALQLANNDEYFDGVMSVQTAQHLAERFVWGSNVTSSALIDAHIAARRVVGHTKNKLYQSFRAELTDQLQHDDPFFTYLDIIDRMWNQDPTLDRHEAMELLLERGRWADIATVLGQDDVSPSQIDTIIDSIAVRPGYTHALRMAAIHPSSSTATLIKLHSLPRLASDDDIDVRYRKIISNRLGQYS